MREQIYKAEISIEFTDIEEFERAIEKVLDQVRAGNLYKESGFINYSIEKSREVDLSNTEKSQSKIYDSKINKNF